MIGFARSAHASVCLRRPATLLGKSIDCPLVFASPNHDNLGFLRPRCSGCAGLEREKGDGECVPPASHSLSARNFVSGIGARREENFQAIFGAVLLGLVGQHQQPGFVVLVLPCLKKAICRSQRGDIASIGNATCVRGKHAVRGGERRLGLRVSRYGQDHRTSANQNWEGKKPSAQPAGGCRAEPAQ